jgi:hypothetical protein
VQILKVATLAQLGRLDDANQAIAALRTSRPQFELSVRADLGRRKFAADLVNLLEAGLAKAGLKVAQACRYSGEAGLRRADSCASGARAGKVRSAPAFAGRSHSVAVRASYSASAGEGRLSKSAILGSA